MSFDIFLSCFRDGEIATFAKDIAQEILGRDAVKPEDALYDVQYPDGGGSSVYCDEEENEIDGLMFNHAGGNTFFERLWELADKTRSALSWPGEGIPVAITSEDTRAHLPPDLAGGNVMLVQSGQDIQDAIQQTALG